MSNSTPQNDLRREYVKKIKNLDLSDPDFENKFNQINHDYNSSHSQSNHRVNVDKQVSRIYCDDYSDYFSFDPFGSLSRIHNRLYKLMKFKPFFFDNDIETETKSQYNNNDDIFFKSGEFDEKKLDNLNVNTQTNTQNTETQHNTKPQNKHSYYKYVSSMTTYDNNGIRKAKSISRTEKYDGKNKHVKQISKFQDGDKYVEERLNPDGTTSRIEKKIDNNYMLE